MTFSMKLRMKERLVRCISFKKKRRENGKECSRVSKTISGLDLTERKFIEVIKIIYVKGEMGNTVAARNKCHNGSILFLYLTDK